MLSGAVKMPTEEMSLDDLGEGLQLPCRLFEKNLLEGKRVYLSDENSESDSFKYLEERRKDDVVSRVDEALDGMDKESIEEGIGKAVKYQMIKARPTFDNGDIREIIEVSLGPALEIAKKYYRKFSEDFDEEDLVLQEGAMNDDVEGIILYDKTGDEGCRHEDTYSFFDLPDGIWEGCVDCGREVFYQK